MVTRSCGLCLRTLLPHQRWTTCQGQLLQGLMVMDRPPYAPIVLGLIARMMDVLGEGSEAVLCDYCASFIKERTVTTFDTRIAAKPRKRKRIAIKDLLVVKEEEEEPALEGTIRLSPGRKHGMQMTVEHILSGGSMPAPSRPHFLRCVAMLEDSPEHPFLASADGDLRDRMMARRSALLSTFPDCVIRWVFEGQTRVFTDGTLAKNLRRWMADADEAGVVMAPPSITAQMPAACRFCCGAASKPSSSSYAGAVAFGASNTIENALNGIEAEATLDGALLRLGQLLFCLKCHRVAAISYEYDTTLRARIGLPTQATTSDAYYARLVALFRHRQRPSSFFWGTAGSLIGHEEEDDDEEAYDFIKTTPKNAGNRYHGTGGGERGPSLAACHFPVFEASDRASRAQHESRHMAHAGGRTTAGSDSVHFLQGQTLFAQPPHAKGDLSTHSSQEGLQE